MPSYTYFLRGDISGIQDFIFSTKTKGAAKTLKARSWVIQLIAEIGEQCVRDAFAATHIELMLNGGGNFYLFLKTTQINSEVQAIIAALQYDFDTKLFKNELRLTLSCVEVTNILSFGEKWKALHTQSNQDKLRPFSNNIAAFIPFDFEPITQEKSNISEEKSAWQAYMSHLLNNSAFDIEPAADNKTPFIVPNHHSLAVLGRNIRLNTAQNVPNNRLLNIKLPKWSDNLKELRQQFQKDDENTLIIEQHNRHTGQIIEFDDLARFAKCRTGTEKLGILKMDIDNLGTLFNNHSNYEDAQALSQQLVKFFTSHLFELQAKYGVRESNAPQDLFKNNLYTVFAGGDDCFIVGAWDAVFEFAALVQREFANYRFEQFTPDHTKPTLSAGLLLVEAKYPVSRFAKIAEEAIAKAKTGHKNQIAVFGNVLKWNEFERAKNLALSLHELITEKQEPRGILHKVLQLSERYKQVLHRAATYSSIRFPEVWRLTYSIRKSKNRAFINATIVEPYIQQILTGFLNKNYIHPDMYPVAVRWAEFLTKNKDIYHLQNDLNNE
jgi:CRISPR-associated protein Csm1